MLRFVSRNMIRLEKMCTSNLLLDKKSTHQDNEKDMLEVSIMHNEVLFYCLPFVLYMFMFSLL